MASEPKRLRTGTFYLSHKFPSRGDNDSQFGGSLPNGGCVWIRVEESDLDLGEALDKAKPRKGEMVMNTHPLPPFKGDFK